MIFVLFCASRAHDQISSAVQQERTRAAFASVVRFAWLGVLCALRGK
jgi:hypothetical protein